ncbi:MAG: GHKL domain-containing protein [Bacteroidetes bacterium]|nr:MAG: GHKL domain-containing protein [Bacteroidota bacterium]
MKKKYWELNHPILRIIQHLAFWVLSFFVFLYLFKTGAKPEKIDYIYTILFQLTLLPAVYLNIELLLPKLGNKKRILFYLFSLVVLIILFAWINYSFFDDWSAKLFPDYFFISYFTYREIVLFFIVYTIITMLLKLSKSWFLVSELQKELLEKEKQKTEVELKALKAQINPHFFFNTLNSIYSMALDKDERLPGTVLQLSDLMRYFLYGSRDNFIPLEKDLTVVKEYIALQKLRSDAQLDIETKISGEINDQQIAPLLLITFLENAFKHGAKGSSENTFIKLDIKVEKNKLNFTVENNKGYIDDVKTGDHNGLGLENVKRQLELLYPGKHLLNIKDEQDRFVVALQLSL